MLVRGVKKKKGVRKVGLHKGGARCAVRGSTTELGPVKGDGTILKRRRCSLIMKRRSLRKETESPRARGKPAKTAGPKTVKPGNQKDQKKRSPRTIVGGKKRAEC